MDEMQGRMNTRIADINDKIRKYDEAKEEMIEILGPKFASTQVQADNNMTEAKNKFAE